jgi:putative membrane protein insertion efficiency factor
MCQKENTSDKTKISFGNITIEAYSKDTIYIQRYFTRHTERDIAIQNLEHPKKPLWLFFIVILFKFYRKYISQKLGNRCVFDPSCSHYSELAFRKNGFFKGLKLTINRLKRCKPENGGIDEL